MIDTKCFCSVYVHIMGDTRWIAAIQLGCLSNTLMQTDFLQDIFITDGQIEPSVDIHVPHSVIS